MNTFNDSKNMRPNTSAAIFSEWEQNPVITEYPAHRPSWDWRRCALSSLQPTSIEKNLHPETFFVTFLSAGVVTGLFVWLPLFGYLMTQDF